MINNIKIELLTGSGGKASFFYFLKNKKKIYNGGNGGNGGNIFIICDKNIYDTKSYLFYKKLKTKNGFKGKSFNRKGKNGNDIIIRVPLNTIVMDLLEKKIFNLNFHKKVFLLLKGGIGEISFNNKKKSNYNLTKGFKKIVNLNFNYYFFLCIIGLPNTGKSTFINTIINKKNKINNYIFSTLKINIYSINNLKILDTPGIIKNSLYGKGLGINFLNFVKNSKIFFHFVDLSLINYNFINFYFNIKILNNELYKYNKNLFYKSRFIIFNKIDLLKINFKVNFFKNFLFFYKWNKKFFILSSLNVRNCHSILNFFFKK